MSDGPLFDRFHGRSEQEQELSRVRSRIGRAVQSFIQLKAGSRDPFFYAEDLRTHIDAVAPSAPGSPDRILRDLRQRGFIRYEVVNRAKSLYMAIR